MNNGDKDPNKTDTISRLLDIQGNSLLRLAKIRADEFGQNGHDIYTTSDSGGKKYDYDARYYIKYGIDEEDFSNLTFYFESCFK